MARLRFAILADEFIRRSDGRLYGKARGFTARYRYNESCVGTQGLRIGIN